MAVKLAETEGGWTTTQVTVKVVKMSQTPKMLDADTRKRLAERIADFSTSLSGQQINVLRLSWGIEDGVPKNNAEIAQRLRLTSEQVAQILSTAQSIISAKETEWLEENSGSLA